VEAVILFVAGDDEEAAEEGLGEDRALGGAEQIPEGD
jgi:hypothetical protein